jgi:hypothetical protein
MKKKGRGNGGEETKTKTSGTEGHSLKLKL